VSRLLSQRLSKFEAIGRAGRTVSLFGWGKSRQEIEAEKAEMLRAGQLSDRDTDELREAWGKDLSAWFEAKLRHMTPRAGDPCHEKTRLKGS